MQSFEHVLPEDTRSETLLDLVMKLNEDDPSMASLFSCRSPPIWTRTPLSVPLIPIRMLMDYIRSMQAGLQTASRVWCHVRRWGV